jgi:hypothetical protein
MPEEQEEKEEWEKIPLAVMRGTDAKRKRIFEKDIIYVLENYKRKSLTNEKLVENVDLLLEIVRNWRKGIFVERPVRDIMTERNIGAKEASRIYFEMKAKERAARAAEKAKMKEAEESKNDGME